MPRIIALELDKLHGFLRMGHFVDKGIAPCVRSKQLINIDNLSRDYYTVKAVKENNTCDKNCKKSKPKDCSSCATFNPFLDFNLPIIKKITVKEIGDWTSNLLEQDPDYNFFYYKYFEATSFGKLIIHQDYYCIEKVCGQNTDHIIENDFLWKDDDFPNRYNTFSKTECECIVNFGSKIGKEMSLYLQSGYSIIMDFAFTSKNYFPNKLFPKTNLLFYGMRSAYNMQKPINTLSLLNHN